MIKKSKILVVDHNPKWEGWFEELKLVFEKHLGELIIAVEHVGSTSIQGLAAKSIIDLDIIVNEKDEHNFNKVIKKLGILGYIHVGDLGILGREAFKRTSPQVPLDGSERNWINHHLYVCKKGTIGLQNHLKFRDCLIENEKEKSEYGKLKRKLAEKFPNDIDAYIDGKTEFIVNILRKLNFQEMDLKKIENQNKAK